MSINYVKGDAVYPVGLGKKFIIHVTNNVGGWGAGFVLSISKRWPTPERMYRRAYAGGEICLGRVQFVSVENIGREDEIVVANMCAQEGVIRRPDIIPLDYTALKLCLDRVYQEAEQRGYTIHGPKFGSGLAGGNWDKIEKMLIPLARRVDTTIYELY